MNDAITPVIPSIKLPAVAAKANTGRKNKLATKKLFVELYIVH
jgi:hypothetical protein